MALFVGTADPLIRTEGRERDGAGGVGIRSLAETEARWAGNNGCSSSPTVTTLPDSAPADRTRASSTTYDSCEAAVTIFVIDGGGHTWPGGTERMRLLGRTSHDISASETIWMFFSEQGLLNQ
jgi:polyhydroxybutyrate depolymerase